jgi:hypothetical protein
MKVIKRRYTPTRPQDQRFSTQGWRQDPRGYAKTKSAMAEKGRLGKKKLKNQDKSKSDKF